ncbi:MAG: hypothetical protein LBF12_07180 [Christensenellaceae bacterium]|nr:hypothetical protein [Christensenellaceae bacterium]
MNILSFDIESCSGDHNDASMCSFGYCMSDENYNILKQEDILINPYPKGFYLGRFGRTPSVKLAYPESMFRSSPSFPAVYDKIANLFKPKTLVIGFAIENDIKYLNNACDVYSLPRIEFEYLDIQLLIKVYKKTRTDVSLENAIRDFSVNPTAKLHKSDEDARMTLMLAKNFCKQANLNLFEFANNDEIRMGVNLIEYSRLFACRKYFDLNYGFQYTKKMKLILLGEFTRNYIPNLTIKSDNLKLKNKIVGISSKLMLKNFNICRDIIASVFEHGGNYSSRFSKCDMIVGIDGEDSIEAYELELMPSELPHTKITKLIELSNYISEYGDLTNQPMSTDKDAQILFEYYSQKVQNNLTFLNGTTNLASRIQKIRNYSKGLL